MKITRLIYRFVLGSEIMTEQLESQKRASIVPLFLAPFAGLIYYTVLQAAFYHSQPYVFNEPVQPDGLNILWGKHWLYRLISEVFSIFVAVAIASGVSRGRERAGAILGALPISIIHLLIVLGAIFSYFAYGSTQVMSDEPWYQFVVGAMLVAIAPAIALNVADSTADANRESSGFLGINRLHYIWLWLVFHFYARGLIALVAKIYMSGSDGSTIQYILTLMALAVPVGALGVPLYFGLGLLSGLIAPSLHYIARNLLGVVVLIGGLLLGGLIQHHYARLFSWVFGG
jgi:hypothetical protein